MRFEKICPNCLKVFYHKEERVVCCSIRCSNMQRSYSGQNLVIENNKIISRRCVTCKEIKSLDKFAKDQNSCKDCNKIYRVEKSDIIKIQQAKYREENREEYRVYAKKYNNKNNKLVKEKRKIHNRNFAKYDSCAHKIDFCEEVRRALDNRELIEVKCSNCGKWMKPTNKSIQHRIYSINNIGRGENRFYCSEECKSECPIFGQKKYFKTNEPSIQREVQPELRKMCLERDDFKCIRCGSDKDLICHHIEGLYFNPLESADLDLVMTVCENCHREIHGQNGCKTSDMRCI